jgi:4a-hydroxytetrahydrobiopterin dehydratase
MDDSTSARPLTRPQASAAVSGHGWRYLLGAARTSVGVASLRQAADVAALVAADPDAAGRLLMDLRPHQLILTVQNLAAGSITASDAEFTRRVSAMVADLGLRTDPDTDSAGGRAVQLLEIAIDALDIAAIRPFWLAVLGYGDEPGRSGPQDPIVDPSGQCPAIWFQQMTEPRQQRNRIHLDISVPHDQARERLGAAIAAGGVLVSDDRAPAFWVLADAEGNEACITTWQGRDS